MKVIYNYKHYLKPKVDLYYYEGGEYGIRPETNLLGWNIIVVEATVIGEDNDSYITELKKHRICDTRDKDYGKMVLLPLGEQLNMFD